MLILDEAWSKVDPQAAVVAGYGGIIGYVSQDSTGKDLTRAQIDQAHAAGLAVGFVYEFNPQSARGGYPQGRTDGTTASLHARMLGVPTGTCIYSAVDFDAQETDLTEVTQYMAAFDAVVRSFGYSSGVYGGFRVCAELPAMGYHGRLWQTYAWSGGRWAPNLSVRQVQNGIHVGAANVDKDTSDLSNWGQWASDPAPVPINPKEFAVTHWTTVRQGDKGQAVSDAQGLLIAHGLPVGSRTGLPDADFGPTTAQSTRAFQAAHGLHVDAEFGPHTLSVALFGVDVA